MQFFKRANRSQASVEGGQDPPSSDTPSYPSSHSQPSPLEDRYRSGSRQGSNHSFYDRHPHENSSSVSTPRNSVIDPLQSTLVIDHDLSTFQDPSHPAHRTTTSLPPPSLQQSLQPPTVSLIIPTSDPNYAATHLTNAERREIHPPWSAVNPVSPNPLDNKRAAPPSQSPYHYDSGQSDSILTLSDPGQSVGKSKKKGFFGFHSHSQSKTVQRSSSTRRSFHQQPNAQFPPATSSSDPPPSEALPNQRRGSLPFARLVTGSKHGMPVSSFTSPLPPAQPAQPVQPVPVQLQRNRNLPSDEKSTFYLPQTPNTLKNPSVSPSTLHRQHTDPLNLTNQAQASHKRGESETQSRIQVSPIQQQHLQTHLGLPGQDSTSSTPLLTPTDISVPAITPSSALSSMHPAHQASTHADSIFWRRRSPQPDSILSARPSSRQSAGRPPSPLPPSQPVNSDPFSHTQQVSSPTQRPSDTPDMTTTDHTSSLRQTSGDSMSQPSVSRHDSQHGPPSSYAQTPGNGNMNRSISQQNVPEQNSHSARNTSLQQHKGREDFEEMDVRVLLQKHEELQAKYTKVKRYYFEKDAQVQQLQNTVAHQRMAVSRTLLDDNEYIARFNRLDSAIKDLAFSIRKDWTGVPNWLQAVTNEDAAAVGTKEMTAVGRAVISQWLVNDIFDRYFHPGLEPNFSMKLKTIEMNLRRQQVQTFNEEDRENQVARISNWRRATLDGIGEDLQSQLGQETRIALTQSLIEKLIAHLKTELKDPAPPEVDQGARMIVENAMGIADKIPFEARDICVEYFMPGRSVTESNMRFEATIPALNRAGPSDQGHRPSVDRDRPAPDEMEVERDGGSSVGDSSKENQSQPGQSAQQPLSSPPNQAQLPANRDQRKKYVFGNFISKKSAATEPGKSVPPLQQQSSNQSGSSSAANSSIFSKENPNNTGTSNSGVGSTSGEKPTEDTVRLKDAKVRLAAFMAVEVRGRGPHNVLVKAPVYLMDQ